MFLMNSAWTQFMNWLDEPFMNILINVHHLMNFISVVTLFNIQLLKLNNLNFHQLEVVFCYRDPQLQVSEN